MTAGRRGRAGADDPAGHEAGDDNGRNRHRRGRHYRTERERISGESEQT